MKPKLQDLFPPAAPTVEERLDSLESSLKTSMRRMEPPKEFVASLKGRLTRDSNVELETPSRVLILFLLALGLAFGALILLIARLFQRDD